MPNVKGCAVGAVVGSTGGAVGSTGGIVGSTGTAVGSTGTAVASTGATVWVVVAFWQAETNMTNTIISEVIVITLFLDMDNSSYFLVNLLRYKKNTKHGGISLAIHYLLQ
jgi:hypothetical protein